MYHPLTINSTVPLQIHPQSTTRSQIFTTQAPFFNSAAYPERHFQALSRLAAIVACVADSERFSRCTDCLRSNPGSPRSIAMGVNEDFDKAAKEAKELKSKPSDDDLLILYGLFKVATVGKVDTTRPGIFDPKGKAKWDAWKKVENKSPEEAKTDYILKVKQLQEA